MSESEQSSLIDAEEGEELDHSSSSLSKRRRFEDETENNRRERPDRVINETDQQDRRISTETSSSSSSHTMNDSSASSVSPAGEDKLELRLLIESSIVGAIIGRQGATIKKLREDNGAFINVVQDQGQMQARERVMVVRGTVPQLLATFSALLDVIHDSLRARESRIGAPGEQGNDPSTLSSTAKLVLLVHRVTVGAIIGKGGETIKSTGAETGARIQVSPDPLPGSTEKTVAVIGTKPQVMNALERVMTQIKNSTLKPGTQNIPFQPNAALGAGMRGSFDQIPQQGFGGNYGQMQVPRFGSGGDDRRGAGFGDRNGPNAGYGGYALGVGAPVGAQAGFARDDNQGAISEQKIAIPSICAGCVIGRGGEVIKALRAQSGCQIQVENQDTSNPSERVVVIKGSQHAIQTAVKLIRGCVENYRPSSNQSGAH